MRRRRSSRRRQSRRPADDPSHPPPTGRVQRGAHADADRARRPEHRGASGRARREDERQGRNGKKGEHQRREPGLGAVHIAVGQVGSAGAQRRCGAVERLSGRSAEVGAGMQHAKCELDVRVTRRDAPGGTGDGVAAVEGQADRRRRSAPVQGRVSPSATRWRGTHPSGCGGRDRRTMPRRRRRQGGPAARTR